MSPLPGSPWRAVVLIARGQHGVVTRRQLLGADIDRDTIRRWLRKGLLHREYRGVYRVGHRAPSTEAKYLAAVLACGEGAKLSGHAAAHHRRLRRGRPPAPEVTAPNPRRVRGVIVHRGRPLAAPFDGIPTATPAQILQDLAAGLDIDQLAELAHNAQVIHGLEPEDVRTSRIPGAAKLRAVLLGDHPTTLSELERDFLAALRAAGLPLPATNIKLDEGYVDCRYPGITIELDSYRYHRTRKAWEADRDRERRARARGDEHRRYTWADVHEHREPMLDDVRGLLARR